MNSWSVLFIALAAVVLQAWVSRRGAPGWYMGCIIPPALWGGGGLDVCGSGLPPCPVGHPLGSALPITLLISLGERTSPPRIPPLLHRTPAHNDKGRLQDEPAAGSNRSRGWLCHRSGPSHNFLLCLPPSPHPVSLQSFSLTYKKAQPGLPDSLNRQRPGGSLLRVFLCEFISAAKIRPGPSWRSRSAG